MGRRLSSAGKWLLGALGRWKVCDCCEEGIYVLACPCFVATTEPPTLEQCGTTEEPCIALDVRSMLDDAGGQLWTRWHDIWAAWVALEPIVIKLDDDHCYRLTPFLVADPGVSDEVREDFLESIGAPEEFFPTDIIAGTDKLGGKGTTFHRVDDCTEDSGCVAFPAGGEWKETFDCQGGIGGERDFICAANQGFVIPDNLNCRCIAHDTRYTDAEVDAIELLEAVNRRLTLEFYTWWQYDSENLFYCAPAPCCWCLGGGPTGGGPIDTVGGSLCCVGHQWHNVEGGTTWAASDLCCGKQETLRFEVDITFRSERTLTDSGHLNYFLDELQDLTVTDNAAGGVVVNFNLRQLRQQDGVTISDNLNPSGDIIIGPTCCLFGEPNRYVPWPGTFIDHPDVADGPGSPGSERCTSQRWQMYTGDYTDAEQLREAYNLSPWAAALQILSDALPGSRSSTGAYASDRCTHATFELHETYHDASGPDDRTVDVSIDIRAVYDMTAPCGPSGGCTSSGWGEGPVWEYIP